MRFVKLVALMGLAITVTNAQAESSCGGVPTVFVTVPASEVTTTITVALDTVPSNANIKMAKVADAPTRVQMKDILTHITTTVTDYVMFTQVVSSVEATPPAATFTSTPVQTSSKPVVVNQGPYYFTAHGGTTFWLGGKTPPAGKSYSTSTTMITVLPVPPSSQLLNEESTSYSTVTLTRVSVVLNKVELFKTIPEDVFAFTAPKSTMTPAASTKPFNGLGSTGWNKSSPSLKFKEFESGATLLRPHRHQTRFRENFAASFKTLPALLASTHSSNVPASTYSVNTTKFLEARQFGATVFATIEGVLVSWINTYPGVSPATSEPTMAISSVPTHKNVQSPTPAKTAKIPVYPWDVQSFSTSNPVEETTNLKALTKTVKIPVYPWDVQSFSLSNSAETVNSPVPSKSLPLGPSSTRPSALNPEYGSPTDSHDKVKSTFLTLPRTDSTRIVTSIISIEQAYPTSLRSGSVSSNGSSIPSPTVSAVPSTCNGEASTEAEFIVDFDDLPHFSTGPNDTDIPPIFNPYRKLFFEDHYGYVPPPSDPFLPHSPPQLAVYRANAGQNVDGSPDAGLESVGEFGAGPRGSSSAFWVDAHSVWLGCANEGPSDCIVTINGYDFTHSTRTVFQTVILPPCPGLLNCTLTFVQFAEAFQGLSGIQILAAVDQTFTVYYMDDIKLAWSNNTCAAQLERSAVR